MRSMASLGCDLRELVLGEVREIGWVGVGHCGGVCLSVNLLLKFEGYFERSKKQIVKS
jgi:hypothetical protein